VIRAAQIFGAKSVGVELDRGLAEESRKSVSELKLEDKVTIIQGDLLQTDLSPATVITLYLLVSANELLRPILEKTLKPGTRVVAHDMRVPGWEAYREEPVQMGNGTHFVYLYRIPEAFQKR
jgi:protein-L-isoaspartate O-methyltransferase